VPTDVSRPEWQCDICRSAFGANLAAAQRCEAAGPPVYLPDGELCLHYRENHAGGAYQFVVLHPVPQVGTVAATWNKDSGHVARYEADGDRYENRNRTWEHTSLWPAVPGKLSTLRIAHQSGLGASRPSASRGSAVTGWAYQTAGLPADPERVREITGRVREPALVGPLTGPVREALDMLRAVPAALPSWDPDGFQHGQPVIAAEETGRRDGLPEGTYDPARLACWLAQADPTEMGREITGRWRRWRDGEDLRVPVPRLTTRSGLSASKLTRPQRAVIDAAGVPWPPRTSAAEYADLLVKTALGVPVTTTTSAPGSPALFSTVPCRIAVTSTKGGVGKTTVAAATAARLAADGHHVMLADLNLPNPGQHILWGLGPADVDAQARLIRGQQVPVPPGGTGTLRVFSHGQLAAKAADAVIDLSRAGEWLTFLAGALDLRGTDIIVFDLPPGWDSVHQNVFDRYQTGLTGVVHVTTGNPMAARTEIVHGSGLPNAELGPRWLVENLSRARGPVVGGDGTEAEIRLYGTSDQPVRDLAATLGIAYAGSLPWEPSPIALAGAPEIRALAAALAAAK
jgi:Mrp family chromosome partitioning ATPase